MKTVKGILDLHIKPLITKDQYNDYEQAIGELEGLVVDAQKKLLHDLAEVGEIHHSVYDYRTEELEGLGVTTK